MKFRIIVFLLLNSLATAAFAAEKKQRVEIADVGEPISGRRYLILTNDKNHYLRYNAEAKGLEVAPRDEQNLLTLMQDPTTHFRFTKKEKNSGYNISAQNQHYLSGREGDGTIRLWNEALMDDEFELVRERDGIALRSKGIYYVSLGADVPRFVTGAIGQSEHLNLFEVPFNSRVISDARKFGFPILADGLRSFSLDLVGLVADYRYEKPDEKPDPKKNFKVTISMSPGEAQIDLGRYPRAIEADVRAVMAKWGYETVDLGFRFMGHVRRAHAIDEGRTYYLRNGSLPAIFGTQAWQAWKAEMSDIRPDFQKKIEAAEQEFIKYKAADDHAKWLANWPVVTPEGFGGTAYPNKEAAVADGVVFSAAGDFVDGERVVIFLEACGFYIYAKYRKYRIGRFRGDEVEYSTATGRKKLDLHKNEIKRSEIGKIPVKPAG